MSLVERIEVLAQMKAGGTFKNYIDYVRFPRFRSLEANARIDFEFPVTMLVGPNGCGKSSALQALYGVPKGRSVGTYWFTTAIDPIVDLDPEDRHCLIYSCNGGGRDKEVLKTRINKAGQPDLWDTSQPIARYDMKMGVRNAPVEKPVQYINFRAVQNAFEKRFHSERPPRSGTQQYLRYRSQYLRSVIRGATRLGRFWQSTRNPFDAPVALTAAELAAMNKILGRTYLSAKIIKHRFYEFWGYSVLLETSAGSYSEAFAGSGETAVALLVHEVISAPRESLLLLDEPETSLHPGAQRAVLEFLVEQCINNHHQIVVSTHAPALVENLPKSAIKVFFPTTTGGFSISQNVRPEEAFFFIGQPVTNKTIIRVEDYLARLIVEAVLQTMGDATANLFDVRFQPGGAEAIKQDAAMYARDASQRVVLLLDGDKKPPAEIYNPAALPMGTHDDPDAAVAFLDARILEATGVNIRFVSDGGAAGGNKEQQRDLRKDYLNFLRSSLRFLPADTPELMLWNDSVATDLLQGLLSTEDAAEAVTVISGLGDAKEKMKELALALCGSSTSRDIATVEKMLITKWIADAPQSFVDLKGTLEEIANS